MDDKKADASKDTTKTSGPSQNKAASSGTSAKTQKHAKSGPAKPVTIDLEAKTIEKTPDKTADKAGATTDKRSSTPKVAKAEPLKAASTADKAGDTAKSEVAPKADNKAAEAKPSAAPKEPVSTAAKAASDKSGSDPATAAKDQSSAKKGESSGGAGFGSLLIAAFLGGLLALGGAWLAQSMGWLGFSSANTQRIEANAALSEEVAELREQLNAARDNAIGENRVVELVDARLGEQPESPTGDTSAIEGQIASLKSDIERLSGEITGVTKTTSDLQSAVSSGEAGETAGLSALTARLDDLSAKVTGLETAEPAASADVDLSPLQERLSALAASLSTQQTALSELNNKVDQQAQSALTAESIAGEVIPVRESVAQLQASLEQQGSALASLQDKMDNGADRRAATALAAAALKSDIDRGLPFDNSLSVLNSVADEQITLEPLADYAQKGVPTQTQLTTRFADLRNRMAEAVMPKGESGTLDRLFSSAKSLVKVKPIGAIEGSSIDAVLSRIGASLSSGALADANSEWQSLPDVAKAVSAEWQKDLEARLAANQLLSSTVQSFMSATSSN